MRKKIPHMFIYFRVLEFVAFKNYLNQINMIKSDIKYVIRI